jgi:hypothetical protein
VEAGAGEEAGKTQGGVMPDLVQYEANIGSIHLTVALTPDGKGWEWRVTKLVDVPWTQLLRREWVSDGSCDSLEDAKLAAIDTANVGPADIRWI